MLINVSGSLSSNTTWIAGNTYHLTDNVTLDSYNLTLDCAGGDIVIKTSSGNKSINVNGSGNLTVTNADPINKVIFTSVNDNSKGETISGSTGTPSKGDQSVRYVNITSTSCVITVRYTEFWYCEGNTGVFTWNHSSDASGVNISLNFIVLKYCGLPDSLPAISSLIGNSQTSQPIGNLSFNHISIDNTNSLKDNSLGSAISFFSCLAISFINNYIDIDTTYEGYKTLFFRGFDADIMVAIKNNFLRSKSGICVLEVDQPATLTRTVTYDIQFNDIIQVGGSGDALRLTMNAPSTNTNNIYNNIFKDADNSGSYGCRIVGSPTLNESNNGWYNNDTNATFATTNPIEADPVFGNVQANAEVDIYKNVIPNGLAITDLTSYEEGGINDFDTSGIDEDLYSPTGIKYEGTDIVTPGIYYYLSAFSCWNFSGYDPLEFQNFYIEGYNGYGVIDEINNGGFEIVVDMQQYYQGLYPEYIGGGNVTELTVPVDGSITVTKLYVDNEIINLNSLKWEDLGILAEYNSSETGKIDIIQNVKRYGYVNLYKKGVYLLNYVVEYLGVRSVTERKVFVVEPNWIENIVPNVWLENSDLFRQIITRLSDIYWEQNYLTDHLKFNFDSRLKEVPMFTINWNLPQATFHCQNDVDLTNNILSLKGYTYRKNDLIRVSAAGLPTPLQPSITYTVKEVLNEKSWKFGKNYYVGDYVERFEDIYICIQSNSTIAPEADSSYWVLGCRIILGYRAVGGVIVTQVIYNLGSDVTAVVYQSDIRVSSQGFIFELQRNIAEWSNVTAYEKYRCVWYKYKVWRCILDNTNIAPDTDDRYWLEGIEHPGTPRNYWKSSGTYIENDLVEHTYDIEGLTTEQFIANEEPTYPIIGKRSTTNTDIEPMIDSQTDSYWRLAYWKCINDFQRIGIIEDEIAVKLAESMGIPDWLYYEIVDNVKSRVALNRMFKHILNSRCTEDGFKSLLNLVGLFSDPYRLEPEESIYPDIDNYFSDYLFFKGVQKDIDSYPRRGVWNSSITYDLNDVVYLDKIAYVSLISSNTDILSVTASWRKIWEYTPVIGDNSYYRISVTGFNSLEDTADCIEDEELQFLIGRLLSKLLNFSIPAYLRYDADLNYCNTYRHHLSHHAMTSFIDSIDDAIYPFWLYFDAKIIESGGITGGIVTGDDFPTSPRPIYPNTQIWISAIPDSGYHFDHWELLDYGGVGVKGAGGDVTINDINAATTFLVTNHGHVKVRGVFEAD